MSDTRWTVRCPNHPMSDSRAFGRYFDTYEEAEEFASAARARAEDGLGCQYQPVSEDDRAAITGAEALHLLLNGMDPSGFDILEEV